MKIAQITIVIAYMGMIWWLAERARKETKGLNDYLCPKVGPWTVALTGFATAFSTSKLIVGGGFGYQYGPSSLWMALPQGFGMALLYLLFAAPMMSMTKRLGSLTVCEFIGDRYKSDTIRAVSAVILFVFCIGNLIVIYRGVGLVVQQILGVPLIPAVLLAGTVSALYTAYGGQLAVIKTDVVQGWMMAIGMLILFPILIIKGGGLDSIHLALAKISPKLIGTPGNWQLGILLGMTLSFSIGMLGQPQLIYRTMFIKDKRDIPKIAIITFFIAVITSYLTFYSGIAGRVLIPTAIKSDLAMPTLLNMFLHPLLAAVIMTAMCAAAMSTTDSILIMASAAVSRDVYQKMINPKASDEYIHKMSAYLSFFLGMVGTLWALKPPSWFLFLMAFVWAVWTAAYLFPILYGLYWRGVTAQGALAGMILGPAFAVYWQIIGQPYGIHAIFPGIAVSALLIPIVSMFTPKLPEEFLDNIFPKKKLVSGAKTESTKL